MNDRVKKIIKSVTTKKFRDMIFFIINSDARMLSYQRRYILKKYKDSNEKEHREIISYLLSHKLSFYNYFFCGKYENRNFEVFFDRINKLNYVYHNDKKMYLSRELDTIDKIKYHYNLICLEQDKDSPHRYVFDKNKLYTCVLDIGTGEGNFALEIIDNVNKLYLFESDSKWVEALKCTFAPYNDKVHIIEKYVSNKNSDDEICLDDFFINKEKGVDHIKIDVEGAELLALEGAKNLLNNNLDLEINICAYHDENHEYEIRRILKEFDINCKGYMAPTWEKNKKIQLRRGVLHCIRKKKREDDAI